MATVRKMIQLCVEQWSPDLVKHVTGLQETVGLFLDPTKKTVVREITTEALGSVLWSGAGGALGLGVPENPFSELRILPVHGERPLRTMYGPSSVDSPEITGAGGALLTVSTVGYTVDSGDLNVGRAIAGHAYIDEVD